MRDVLVMTQNRGSGFGRQWMTVSVLGVGVSITACVLYHLVKRDPVMHRRADRLFAAGQYAAAAPLYATLAERGFVPAYSRRRAAEAYAALDSRVQARQQATAALSLSPDDEVLVRLLADLQVADGDFNDAIITYGQYLERMPDHASVRLQLARVLRYAGDMRGAATQYRKALGDIP